MTDEEMATALRAKGWRVQVPLTKENCKHPNRIGTGMLCSSGASRMSWYCRDCGASYEYESPAVQTLPKLEAWN